ncbi:MAG TPA: GyrI-like domain-containing protein [Anaerolineales bacterium]|nr:GyrI-like domain-containing protein [Anaerolineales bacterium]
MTTIGKPKIDTRPEQVYMGIRTIAPFKGMSKVVDRISKDLNTWVNEQGIEPAGPPFLRFHVIDMRGTMDITFGVPVRKALPDDGQVKAAVIPAGRYASLIYSGGGISANRALIEWVRAQGLDFDRWDTEQGDNFRSRYETYLTDPKIEPRKSKWKIEVAIKLADQ